MNPNMLLMGVGILAGILAGFFGIGGGLIIIPFLVLILGYSQHMANGTSLVALWHRLGFSALLSTTRPAKSAPTTSRRD